MLDTQVFFNMLGKRILEYKLSFLGAILNLIGRLGLWLMKQLPGGRIFEETRHNQTKVDLYRWFNQRVLGINGGAYWPMHPSSYVSYAKRVYTGIETSPGWSPGCYINGVNGIYIGDYTQVSVNVGLISGNHEHLQLREQVSADPIIIGKYCLLSMNCVILPSVELGDYTIVGANSVVTKSFPDGFVVIAGSPAKVIRHLDPAKRQDYRSKHEYNGYIPSELFPAFVKKHLHLPWLKK